MASERSSESSSRIAARLRLALEDRLARLQRTSGDRGRPRRRSGRRSAPRPTPRTGSRPPARRSALPLPRSRACPPPGRARGDPFADELRGAARRPQARPDATLRELLGDPALDQPSSPPQTRGWCPLSRTPSRGPSSSRPPPRPARAPSRGRGLPGSRQRLDIRGFPAALEAAVGVASPVDVLDDDEPQIAEQAAGVAQGDDCLGGGVERADDIRRLRHEVPAQAAESDVDLGTVAAGEEINRLVGSVRHGVRTLTASVRTRILRPSDSTITRRCVSVRYTASPGTVASAASVSARGCP